ncbi:hypothetical protein CEN49_12020 [Fischerella thermalis CCMEE 5273]|nr:hypothetical protein CEN49_12020 [Fischerella thermalis CCMEE 5273]
MRARGKGTRGTSWTVKPFYELKERKTGKAKRFPINETAREALTGCLSEDGVTKAGMSVYLLKVSRGL